MFSKFLLSSIGNVCFCSCRDSNEACFVSYPLRKCIQLIRQPEKKPVKVPKVSELVVGMPKVAPPKEVMDKLKGSDLIIGIDVETHDLIQGNTLLWIPGQFGFQTKTDASIISALRVIQIGWVIGKTTTSAPQVKSEIIKPNGF